MSIKENSAGLGVNNRYGTFTLPDGTVGAIKTEGAVNELTLDFSGAIINNGDEQPFIIPAGSKVLEAYVEVEEAFTLGGTTPTISIGTATTETTNGFNISETQAENTGLYVITTFNGTWANMLAANTTIGIALGGTTPTVTSAGQARVTVRYVKI